MSRPIEELLSRFTPDGSGLDRDALLFAAGRASARPNRRYLALAACLAFSQTVTLAALGFRSAEPRPMAASRETIVANTPELPPPSPPSDDAPVLRSQPDVELPELPCPTGIEGLVPDAPPLPVFLVAIAETP